MTALQQAFAIVHIHGNNYAPLVKGTELPNSIEVTAVNRALLPADLRPSRAEYPITGLDQPNHAGRPDYQLKFTSVDDRCS